MLALSNRHSRRRAPERPLVDQPNTRVRRESTRPERLTKSSVLVRGCPRRTQWELAFSCRKRIKRAQDAGWVIASHCHSSQYGVQPPPSIEVVTVSALVTGPCQPTDVAVTRSWKLGVVAVTVLCADGPFGKEIQLEEPNGR